MRYVFMLVIALLSVIYMFVSVFLIYFQGANSKASQLQYFGQVGDFFGGMLNPILAFASFMALLYTIQIQSKQLNVSTKELEATRIELKASVKAQKDSSDALEGQLTVLRTQRFYDAFSSMLLDIERFSFGDVTKVQYAYSVSNETTKNLGRLGQNHDVEILMELINAIRLKHKVHKNLDEICADTFLFVENADVPEQDKSHCFRRLQILLPEETVYFLALHFNSIMARESSDGYINNVISIIKKRRLLRGAMFTSTPSDIYIELKETVAFALPISVLGYIYDDLGLIGLEWNVE